MSRWLSYGVTIWFEKKHCSVKFYVLPEKLSRLIRKIIFVAQKPRFASENLGWISYGKQVRRVEDIAFHTFVDFQYRPDKATAESI